MTGQVARTGEAQPKQPAARLRQPPVSSLSLRCAVDWGAAPLALPRQAGAGGDHDGCQPSPSELADVKRAALRASMGSGPRGSCSILNTIPASGSVY
jgi:hypothetical protein